MYSLYDIISSQDLKYIGNCHGVELFYINDTEYGDFYAEECVSNLSMIGLYEEVI